jgi:hypothetical protein
LNKLFEDDLKVRFKQVGSGVSEDLKKLFLTTDFFMFDGKRVYTGISSLKIDKNYSNINVSYSSVLNISVGFDNFGLPSFDKIELVRVLCSEGDVKDAEVKTCLESEFPMFNVEVIKLGQMKLTSKDSYYINKEMKKIEFLLFFEYTETESA